jgi:hypothetical protein
MPRFVSAGSTLANSSTSRCHASGLGSADCRPRAADVVAVDVTQSVVGYVAAHPKDGELFLLFVNHAHARRGIGRTILGAAHDALPPVLGRRSSLRTSRTRGPEPYTPHQGTARTVRPARPISAELICARCVSSSSSDVDRSHCHRTAAHCHTARRVTGLARRAVKRSPAGVGRVGEREPGGGCGKITGQRGRLAARPDAFHARAPRADTDERSARHRRIPDRAPSDDLLSSGHKRLR